MVSCCVAGCRSSDEHKLPALRLHRFPENPLMRKKWCAKVGKSDYKPSPSSRICSLHFADYCFNTDGTMKSTAVPTKSFVDWNNALNAFSNRHTKSKTNKELLGEIKKIFAELTPPTSFRYVLGDSRNSAPHNETSPQFIKLWCVINDQQTLINRLMSSSENASAKNMEEEKHSRLELERKLETYKYIVKCLQEKQTTLEEQIEIISAVESKKN